MSFQDLITHCQTCITDLDKMREWHEQQIAQIKKDRWEWKVQLRKYEIAEQDWEKSHEKNNKP